MLMDLSFWTGLGWGLASGLAVTLAVVLWPAPTQPRPQPPADAARWPTIGGQRREGAAS